MHRRKTVRFCTVSVMTIGEVRKLEQDLRNRSQVPVPLLGLWSAARGKFPENVEDDFAEVPGSPPPFYYMPKEEPRADYLSLRFLQGGHFRIIQLHIPGCSRI